MIRRNERKRCNQLYIYTRRLLCHRTMKANQKLCDVFLTHMSAMIPVVIEPTRRPAITIIRQCERRSPLSHTRSHCRQKRCPRSLNVLSDSGKTFTRFEGYCLYLPWLRWRRSKSIGRRHNENKKSDLFPQ